MGEIYDLYIDLLPENGMSDLAQNACGYTMGAVWPPTWMEQPLFYSGNPTVIEKDMIFFNMLILNDHKAGMIMALGEQVIVNDGPPEVVSHVPKEPIIIHPSNLPESASPQVR